MNKQYIHFSFDDVYQCIQDITIHQNEYTSVFENPFFAWLKEMHDRYGAVFSLYTFNYFSTMPEYDISNIPAKYAEELAGNSEWLKFGFHASDDKKKYLSDEPEQIRKDYAKFMEAAMKATGGCVDSIDRVIRMGFCAGTRANMRALKVCETGIQGYLTADNDEKRKSYYFDEEQTAEVYHKGEFWDDGFLYLRSILRMELITSIEEVVEVIKKLELPKVLALFSHESCWYRDSQIEGMRIPDLCEWFIKWAYEEGYGFGFAQDHYEL